VWSPRSGRHYCSAPLLSLVGVTGRATGVLFWLGVGVPNREGVADRLPSSLHSFSLAASSAQSSSALLFIPSFRHSHCPISQRLFPPPPPCCPPLRSPPPMYRQISGYSLLGQAWAEPRRAKGSLQRAATARIADRKIGQNLRRHDLYRSHASMDK